MFEPINRISRVFPHFPSSPKISIWNISEMQFAHETYRVFLFAFRVLCGNIVLNFSGRSRSGVGKLAQLLLSARCVIHPVSIETETPTIFTISSVLPVSPFVSFSIVGLMIKVNKERSNFCATSWAKREKLEKFIWNCAVVPSLRGQSCNLCKTIRLSRSCYR